MTYLRNNWYPAAWAEDVTDKPLGRMFLGEPVVLFRGSDGEAVALSDTCPHRFAPLHMGKVTNGVIACPYHGLQFGPTGACVHNPHGPIIASARLRSYKLAEKYGLFWVWMGAEPANLATLPVVPEFDQPGMDWVHGTLQVAGHYQLVIDNLMDLSHVEFMHPVLAIPGSSAFTNYSAQVESNTVFSTYELPDSPLSPLISMTWPDAPERIAMLARIRWNAPATLVLDQRVTTAGGDYEAADVIKMPTTHFLAPADATSTHYFWTAGRNVFLNNPDFDRAQSAGIAQAFKNEDEAMVAAVQARMALLGPETLKPLLLKTDVGSVQARRILARLIEAEVTISAAA